MNRVLIVDDKPENLYMLRQLLQGNGYAVDEARHGAEALIKARQAPPQLIISDLLMPVMDGYTLLRQWKAEERLKAIPFIVYTATYTEPNDERLAVDMGADAFILKPAEPQPFMARIQGVLAQAERGELAPSHPPQIEEKVTLGQYNEVLIRKLEEKAFQLEQANRELTEDIARRQQAEAASSEMLAETVRARSALLNILEDQRQTEAALRESRARLQLSVDASHIGLWDWNLLSNEVYFSPEWKRQLGYGDDELPNHFEEWETRLHPDDRVHTLAAVNDYLAGQRPSYDAEFRLRHKNGSWRWILARSEIVRDSNQQPTRMMGCHINLTERKEMEDELRASRDRLEALSRRLFEVQETERRHLARELHDEIGQVLTVISINLKAVSENHPSNIVKRMGESIAIVDELIHRVRGLSLDLRPAMLDDLGLAAAVRWYVERQAERAGFKVELVSKSTGAQVPAEVKTACFRVAQEAVTNIVRYAKARQVQIRLHQCEAEVELTVQDDGVGFDAAGARTRAAHGSSIGLLGMEERVQLLGGRFDICSKPGQGTTVHAHFPIPAPKGDNP